MPLTNDYDSEEVEALIRMCMDLGGHRFEHGFCSNCGSADYSMICPKCGKALCDDILTKIMWCPCGYKEREK